MTKAAKQQRDDARAGGKIPLLTRELAQCRAMAAARKSTRSRGTS